MYFMLFLVLAYFSVISGSVVEITKFAIQPGSTESSYKVIVKWKLNDPSYTKGKVMIVKYNDEVLHEYVVKLDSLLLTKEHDGYVYCEISCVFDIPNVYKIIRQRIKAEDLIKPILKDMLIYRHVFEFNMIIWAKIMCKDRCGRIYCKAPLIIPELRHKSGHFKVNIKSEVTFTKSYYACNNPIHPQFLIQRLFVHAHYGNSSIKSTGGCINYEFPIKISVKLFSNVSIYPKYELRASWTTIRELWKHTTGQLLIFSKRDNINELIHFKSMSFNLIIDTAKDCLVRYTIKINKFRQSKDGHIDASDMHLLLFSFDKYYSNNSHSIYYLIFTWLCPDISKVIEKSILQIKESQNVIFEKDISNKQNYVYFRLKNSQLHCDLESIYTITVNYIFDYYAETKTKDKKTMEVSMCGKVNKSLISISFKVIQYKPYVYINIEISPTHDNFIGMEYTLTINNNTVEATKKLKLEKISENLGEPISCNMFYLIKINQTNIEYRDTIKPKYLTPLYFKEIKIISNQTNIFGATVDYVKLCTEDCEITSCVYIYKVVIMRNNKIIFTSKALGKIDYLNITNITNPCESFKAFILRIHKKGETLRSNTKTVSFCGKVEESLNVLFNMKMTHSKKYEVKLVWKILIKSLSQLYLDITIINRNSSKTTRVKLSLSEYVVVYNSISCMLSYSLQIVSTYVRITDTIKYNQLIPPKFNSFFVVSVNHDNYGAIIIYDKMCTEDCETTSCVYTYEIVINSDYFYSSKAIDNNSYVLINLNSSTCDDFKSYVIRKNNNGKIQQSNAKLLYYCGIRAYLIIVKEYKIYSPNNCKDKCYGIKLSWALIHKIMLKYMFSLTFYNHKDKIIKTYKSINPSIMRKNVVINGKPPCLISYKLYFSAINLTISKMISQNNHIRPRIILIKVHHSYYYDIFYVQFDLMCLFLCGSNSCHIKMGLRVCKGFKIMSLLKNFDIVKINVTGCEIDDSLSIVRYTNIKKNFIASHTKIYSKNIYKYIAVVTNFTMSRVSEYYRIYLQWNPVQHFIKYKVNITIKSHNLQKIFVSKLARLADKKISLSYNKKLICQLEYEIRLVLYPEIVVKGKIKEKHIAPPQFQRFLKCAEKKLVYKYYVKHKPTCNDLCHEDSYYMCDTLHNTELVIKYSDNIIKKFDLKTKFQIVAIKDIKTNCNIQQAKQTFYDVMIIKNLGTEDELRSNSMKTDFCESVIKTVSISKFSIMFHQSTYKMTLKWDYNELLKSEDVLIRFFAFEKQISQIKTVIRRSEIQNSQNELISCNLSYELEAESLNVTLKARLPTKESLRPEILNLEKYTDHKNYFGYYIVYNKGCADRCYSKKNCNTDEYSMKLIVKDGHDFIFTSEQFQENPFYLKIPKGKVKCRKANYTVYLNRGIENFEDFISSKSKALNFCEKPNNPFKTKIKVKIDDIPKRFRIVINFKQVTRIIKVNKLNVVIRNERKDKIYNGTFNIKHKLVVAVVNTLYCSLTFEFKIVDTDIIRERSLGQEDQIQPVLHAVKRFKNYSNTFIVRFSKGCVDPCKYCKFEFITTLKIKIKDKLLSINIDNRDRQFNSINIIKISNDKIICRNHSTQVVNMFIKRWSRMNKNEFINSKSKKFNLCKISKRMVEVFIKIFAESKSIFAIKVVITYLNDIFREKQITIRLHTSRRRLFHEEKYLFNVSKTSKTKERTPCRLFIGIFFENNVLKQRMMKMRDIPKPFFDYFERHHDANDPTYGFYFKLNLGCVHKSKMNMGSIISHTLIVKKEETTQYYITNLSDKIYYLKFSSFKNYNKFDRYKMSSYHAYIKRYYETSNSHVFPLSSFKQSYKVPGSNVSTSNWNHQILLTGDKLYANAYFKNPNFFYFDLAIHALNPSIPYESLHEVLDNGRYFKNEFVFSSSVSSLVQIFTKASRLPNYDEMRLSSFLLLDNKQIAKSDNKVVDLNTSFTCSIDFLGHFFKYKWICSFGKKSYVIKRKGYYDTQSLSNFERLVLNNLYLTDQSTVYLDFDLPLQFYECRCDVTLYSERQTQIRPAFQIIDLRYRNEIITPPNNSVVWYLFVVMFMWFVFLISIFGTLTYYKESKYQRKRLLESLMCSYYVGKRFKKTKRLFKTFYVPKSWFFVKLKASKKSTLEDRSQSSEVTEQKAPEPPTVKISLKGRRTMSNPMFIDGIMIKKTPIIQYHKISSSENPETALSPLKIKHKDSVVINHLRTSSQPGMGASFGFMKEVLNFSDPGLNTPLPDKQGGSMKDLNITSKLKNLDQILNPFGGSNQKPIPKSISEGKLELVKIKGEINPTKQDNDTGHKTTKELPIIQTKISENQSDLISEVSLTINKSTDTSLSSHRNQEKLDAPLFSNKTNYQVKRESLPESQNPVSVSKDLTSSKRKKLKNPHRQFLTKVSNFNFFPKKDTTLKPFFRQFSKKSDDVRKLEPQLKVIKSRMDEYLTNWENKIPRHSTVSDSQMGLKSSVSLNLGFESSIGFNLQNLDVKKPETKDLDYSELDASDFVYQTENPTLKVKNKKPGVELNSSINKTKFRENKLRNVMNDQLMQKYFKPK